MVTPLNEERAWEQFYPTYAFGQRDILLAEYESASAATAAEEKLFLASGNIALVVAAGVSSLAVQSLDQFYGNIQDVVHPTTLACVLIGLLMLFSILTLKHFAERQKAIQIAKRKVVVLRSMLGLDYGPVQLVLPNWRLEGASQPFAISLFPGWTSYPAYPFWITGMFSAVVLTFLAAHYFTMFVVDPAFSEISGMELAVGAGIAWWVSLGIVYRRALYDTHETGVLGTAVGLARLTNLGIVDSTEYTLYRAKLAHHELERLGYDLSLLKRTLEFIEDRGFRTHRGISIRGMIRAARDYATRRKLSGGSSITQQLARTLFVVQYWKTYRRKAVETILALWLESQFDKEKLLDLYLSAVRFDHYVFGVAHACIHFFGAPVTSPSPAQAFFLIERISNIRGRVLVRRVNALALSALETGLLSAGDFAELGAIYLAQVEGGLRPDDQAAWDRVLDKWADIAVAV